LVRRSAASFAASSEAANVCLSASVMRASRCNGFA
jgi:hypothetical protein